MQSWTLSSDHDARLLETTVDLLDRVDEACVPEGHVTIDGDLPVLAAGRCHDLLEARVDDVNLIGTFELGNLVLEAHELEKARL